MGVFSVFSLIVAGSRSFADEGRLFADLDRLLARQREIDGVEIVCGGCPCGADALAERYARSRGLPLMVFPAQWAAFGRAAGPMRNEEMAQYGNALVAYWDGFSPGTKSMIKYAHMYGRRVVVRYF